MKRVALLLVVAALAGGLLLGCKKSASGTESAPEISPAEMQSKMKMMGCQKGAGAGAALPGAGPAETEEE